MTWYYSDGEKQLGPITEEQLIELRRSGSVTAETLVWRDGMANWTPYSEAGPAVNLEGTPTDPAMPPLIPVPPPAQPAGPEAVCAECGKIFPKDEMITHGQSYVCVNCKPIFLQKLSEGAAIKSGPLRYAGFWLRFGAKFVDNLLLRIVSFALGFLIGLAATGSTPEALLLVQVVAGLVSLTLAAGYNIYMIGKFGATLGKMACKIKVVNADGTPVGYGKATGRFFAEILSGCPTLLIGYIIAGSDEEKRALHDRICGTRVVFKD